MLNKDINFLSDIHKSEGLKISIWRNLINSKIQNKEKKKKCDKLDQSWAFGIHLAFGSQNECNLGKS